MEPFMELSRSDAAEKLSRLELRIEELMHKLVEIGIPPRG
jgi:hypothetical protein